MAINASVKVGINKYVTLEPLVHHGHSPSNLDVLVMSAPQDMPHHNGSNGHLGVYAVLHVVKDYNIEQGYQYTVFFIICTILLLNVYLNTPHLTPVEKKSAPT